MCHENNNENAVYPNKRRKDKTKVSQPIAISKEFLTHGFINKANEPSKVRRV
jgi:hypothetical protein